MTIMELQGFHILAIIWDCRDATTRVGIPATLYFRKEMMLTVLRKLCCTFFLKRPSLDPAVYCPTFMMGIQLQRILEEVDYLTLFSQVATFKFRMYMNYTSLLKVEHAFIQSMRITRNQVFLKEIVPGCLVDFTLYFKATMHILGKIFSFFL